MHVLIIFFFVCTNLPFPLAYPPSWKKFPVKWKKKLFGSFYYQIASKKIECWGTSTVSTNLPHVSIIMWAERRVPTRQQKKERKHSPIKIASFYTCLHRITTCGPLFFSEEIKSRHNNMISTVCHGVSIIWVSTYIWTHKSYRPV